MGYDTDRAGMYRQVGAYTSEILKGAKPVGAVGEPRKRPHCLMCFGYGED